ncbi:MAG: YncE family protein [Asticcacaulis sp.]
MNRQSLAFTAALMALAAAAMAAPAMAAPATGLKVLDQIKVGGSGGWDYASFDSATRTVYLSHGASIASVNVESRAVNATLAAASGAHVALAFNGGKSLMITNGKTNTVTLNDAATGAVTATIATDTGPDAAVIDPATGHAFIMANHGGMVDVIDLETKAVLAKISAGGAPEAGAADGEGLVFTHLEDKNAIVVIDARAMKVKATYAMPDCDEPSGIAFIPGKRWLLSACRGGVARISNADTGAEVAKVTIGNRPDFALYDAKRQMGYVPSGDGKLTAIDFSGATPVVAETIATPVGARTGTLDPDTGRIYLPTADFGPPPAAGGWPQSVPDTFRLVVVGK